MESLQLQHWLCALCHCIAYIWSENWMSTCANFASTWQPMWASRPERTGLYPVVLIVPAVFNCMFLLWTGNSWATLTPVNGSEWDSFGPTGPRGAGTCADWQQLDSLLSLLLERKEVLKSSSIYHNFLSREFISYPVNLSVCANCQNCQSVWREAAGLCVGPVSTFYLNRVTTFVSTWN